MRSGIEEEKATSTSLDIGSNDEAIICGSAGDLRL
jgi:hypothetical protein